MQNSVIIKDAIEKIEDCEDLIKEKQSILIENGRNISKGTKAAFDKLEKFEEATEELAARARAYAGVITGIVAVPLATSQILSYGLKLNNNAMIELAIKTAFLMLTYRISYLTNQHINKRIKAKEMYGSYDNYVEEKRKDELHGYEAIEIMDKIPEIIEV